MMCADGAIRNILKTIFEASVSDVKTQLIPVIKQEKISKKIQIYQNYQRLSGMTQIDHFSACTS